MLLLLQHGHTIAFQVLLFHQTQGQIYIGKGAGTMVIANKRLHIVRYGDLKALYQHSLIEPSSLTHENIALMAAFKVISGSLNSMLPTTPTERSAPASNCNPACF